MEQDPDQLYQAFDRNLYKLTGSESEDDILNMMQADPGANNTGSVQVSASDVGSGVTSGTSQQASGSLQQGKATFDNTHAGYILGFDPKDGFSKFYIGDALNYLNWDGTSLTVVGDVSVSSLNIPDTTTANSFHVDTSGNSWWGANVATGLSGANASITNAGAATFKNVAIGGVTTQYVISNSGIFSYGDGSDGTAAFNGSLTPAGCTKSVNTYTLTRDVYYTSMTVSDGVDVITNGYRIFCSLSLTVGGGTSGKVHWDGATGTTGAAGVQNSDVGTTAGVSLTAGYLAGSPTTGTGGSTTSFNPNTGGSGTSVANSLGTSGATGGQGGTGVNSIGSTSTGAAGGTSAGATTSNVKLIANWHLATLLDVSSTGATVKFQNSGPSGGGGAGGKGQNNNGGQTTSGGAGGSGGAAGGIVAIYAKVMVINAGGSITVNGGVGGAGGVGHSNDGTGGSSGGGGGGGGGNGGILVLVYNSLTNSGSLTASGASGGAGGLKGTGGGQAGATDGTQGSTGSSGTIYQFQLSL